MTGLEFVQGLASGALDCLVSDHSPAPPALKGGDFARAWGGIASLEVSLAAAWTAYRAAVARRGGSSSPRGAASESANLAAERSGARDSGTGASEPENEVDSAALVALARWMSAAPAALAGLGDRKGRIAEGLDADLVVWDPDVEFVVHPQHLQQRHKLTPYAGRKLFGTVLTTFVRGERVWDRNRLARAYGGRLL